MATIVTHRVMELVAQIDDGPKEEEILRLFSLQDEWQPVIRPYFRLKPTREKHLLQEVFAEACDQTKARSRFFLTNIRGVRYLTSSEMGLYDMSFGLELLVTLQHESDPRRTGLVPWYTPQTRTGWLFRIIQNY